MMIYRDAITKRDPSEGKYARDHNCDSCERTPFHLLLNYNHF